MSTPVFVTIDASAILSNVVSTFESIVGYTITEGQPEYSFCSCLAYYYSLAMQRINETGKSQLISYSSAPVLDYIAELVGVTRLSASGASCTLQFNLISGHLAVVIPLGTRVASSDGSVIFATDDDVTIPVGTDTVTVSATCSTTGTAGNGYAIGNISTLQDPYAFISSVSNTDATAGGADEETDSELIARVKLAPSTFSVAGSTNAYIYWAKTANSSIIDVNIMTYNEDNTIPYGTVKVYPLITDGQPSTSSINDEIKAVLTSEKIRPLTDTVVVESPSQINYAVVADIAKTKDGLASLTNSLTTIIREYASARSLELGLDVVNSKMASLCMIDGVYSAIITIVPESASLVNGNLPISNGQVSKLTGITINITDSDE